MRRVDAVVQVLMGVVFLCGLPSSSAAAVSKTPNGRFANSDSMFASMSGDGSSLICYASTASDIMLGNHS